MVSHANFLEENMRGGIGIGRGALAMNDTSGAAPGSLYGPESSEFRIVPDLDTYAPLPFVLGSARLISELCDVNLKPYEGDSRYFLRKAIAAAEKAGYSPRVACESEFYLVRKEGDHYVPNTAGYGIEGFIGDEGYDAANEYVQSLFQSLAQMSVSVERLKKESGPAQVEVILRYAEALKAADDFVTLRDAAKGVASKMGLIATFLPKLFQSEGPSGLHVHFSLTEKKTGKNFFFEPKDGRGIQLSDVGYQFIGGVMKHMKGLMPIAAPIPNSYKRFVPSEVWCPVNLTYGHDNRSVAIRVPSRSNDPSGKGARCEFRVSDPTANPYLLIGMLILAGLDGIKRGLDPGEPMNDDAYKLTPQQLQDKGIESIPATLGDALAATRSDTFIKDSMGDLLYRQYMAARESDWNNYCKVVTPWEIDNFILSF
jgi:glutamine synthetase